MTTVAASSVRNTSHSSSDRPRPTTGPGSTDNRNRNIQTGAAWGFGAGLFVGWVIVMLDDDADVATTIGVSTAVGTAAGTALAVLLDDARGETQTDDQLPHAPSSNSSGYDSSGATGWDGRDSGPGDAGGDSSSGGSSDGGDGGCFLAGTPVRLANGSLRAIEAVGIGDLLLSQDPATGVVAGQPATTLFTHGVASTLVLRFSDGSTLHTTAQHRFYVPGVGFIAAGRLRPGSTVVTHSRQHLSVVTCTPVVEKAVVYNLEVAKAHTFFVGEPGIWVHNVKPKDGTGNTPSGDGGS